MKQLRTLFFKTYIFLFVIACIPTNLFSAQKPKQQNTQIKIAGIMCGTTGQQLRRIVKKIKGVKNVKATWKSAPGELSIINIKFDGSKVNSKTLEKTLGTYGFINYKDNKELQEILKKYNKTYKFSKKSTKKFNGSLRNVMCATGKKNTRNYLKNFKCIRKIKIKRQVPNSLISFEYDSENVDFGTLKKDLKKLGVNLIEPKSQSESRSRSD